MVAVGGVVVVPGASGTLGTHSVVLIQRAHPPAAGSWTFPGGRVRRGELLVDAVRREVREEIGVEVEVLELLEIVELVSETHHFIVHDYLARLRDPAATLIAGDDAADVRLVPVDQLEAYGVTEAVSRIVKAAVTR